MVIKLNSSILRRLAALQAFADRQRPALVTVHFADGSTTVTDQSGALDILQELGPRGEIRSFQSDGALAGWSELLTILLHPRENRELSDYE